MKPAIADEQARPRRSPRRPAASPAEPAAEVDGEDHRRRDGEHGAEHPDHELRPGRAGRPHPGCHGRSAGGPPSKRPGPGLRRDARRSAWSARPRRADAIGRAFSAPDRAPAPRPAARSRSPGWRRCPRPRPGRRRACPRRARRGEVRGDLGVVDGEVRAGPEVGRQRVGEVGEGEGPADDRDRVAGLEPALVIGPVAAPIPQPRLLARAVGLLDRRAARPPPATRSISASRVDPLRRMSRPGGSSPAMPVSPSKRTGASKRAPRGNTRMLPDRVADAEADRALLRVARIGCPAVAAVADGRAVVDAGHALEERHEGHLGRLDDAADPDLADGQRRDRGRRDVADVHDRPIGAEPASEQRQADHDADHRGHAEPRAPDAVHARIVRDATVSPSASTGSPRGRPARRPGRWRRSATTARDRRPGGTGGAGRTRR